jgi:hypothetical protein
LKPCWQSAKDTAEPENNYGTKAGKKHNAKRRLFTRRLANLHAPNLATILAGKPTSLNKQPAAPLQPKRNWPETARNSRHFAGQKTCWKSACWQRSPDEKEILLARLQCQKGFSGKTGFLANRPAPKSGGLSAGKTSLTKTLESLQNFAGKTDAQAISQKDSLAFRRT